MSEQYFGYRDLRAYQHAKSFVVFVYSLIKLSLKRRIMRYVINSEEHACQYHQT